MSSRLNPLGEVEVEVRQLKVPEELWSKWGPTIWEGQLASLKAQGVIDVHAEIVTVNPSAVPIFIELPKIPLPTIPSPGEIARNFEAELNRAKDNIINELNLANERLGAEWERFEKRVRTEAKRVEKQVEENFSKAIEDAKAEVKRIPQNARREACGLIVDATAAYVAVKVAQTNWVPESQAAMLLMIDNMRQDYKKKCLKEE